MSKKIIGVAAIVMFIIFTPIAVLATDTKEEQAQTQMQMQIIQTEEEKYIIYVKDLQKEEFNYAIANTPTAKEMELKYIHSSKDDEQNSVIVIDKNVYNVKQNEKAYLWIKHGEREIITGKEIDFSQSFEKSKIEEVENTGKRIKTEIISDLVQEERTDENGVKITVKVGGIKIKDNQNARYFYQIMPATDEYGTLMELAEKIKNEYSQMDMYEKINVAKEFYNKYSNLISKANWNLVEEMQIKQPKEAKNDSKYVVFIKKVEGNQITLDSKFLISKETETPKYEREQKIIEETTKLPITSDSMLLIVALGIIILMMIFVFIKMRKAKNEEDR